MAHKMNAMQRESPWPSRPGSSCFQDDVCSLTSGERDIIRGICQNKFYCNNGRGAKTGQWNVLQASRRSAPKVPVQKRRTFRDMLPRVHVTPIVPRLWTEPNQKDFAAGILKIVREVQVRHLARNVCSGMSVPQFDLRGLGRPACLDKASLPVTNLALPSSVGKQLPKAKHPLESPAPSKPKPNTDKQPNTKPCSSPQVDNKRHHTNTPHPADTRRQTASRVIPCSYMKGTTKARRVVELSNKDGGRLRKKLYLDVFLPSAGLAFTESDGHGNGGVWKGPGDTDIDHETKLT